MFSFEENQVQDTGEICALEIITSEDVLNHFRGLLGCYSVTGSHNFVKYCNNI